ncbi:MAG: serine hydrolase, partial [Gemmatimonadetes bacterium]|nr:serine hydrolase [Gemmatimonadota bacterium]
MRACDLSRVVSVTMAVLAASLSPLVVRPLPGQGAVSGLPEGLETTPANSAAGIPVGPPVPPLYHADRMARMLAEAESMSALTSLIVARRDSVLVENYYRGLRPSQTINVKSVSKTLLSPMVGIALRDGLLDSVGQPISELLPDYYEVLAGRGSLDPRKNEIELRHLLSMRTGIETA